MSDPAAAAPPPPSFPPPPARTEATHPGEGGVAYGLAAYGLWGAMPLYLALLAPSGPWEILAHRVLWSLLLCAIVLAVTRRVDGLRAALRSPRSVAVMGLAGLFIAVNWTVYVVAATTGHVTDAALGYFLNPLVSIALGLLVLHERLRPAQWLAVGIGAAGALYLAVAAGSPPWIALALAVSFGTYGLLKKVVGVSLSAVEGLTAETAVIAPVAVGILVWCAATGQNTFAAAGAGHAALLVSAGVVTAVPLLLFAAAARRVPLVTIGLLQFVTPVLQFAVGLAMGETMSPHRWVGFSIVWCALAVLVVDSLRRAGRVSRTRRRSRRTGPHPADAG